MKKNLILLILFVIVIGLLTGCNLDSSNRFIGSWENVSPDSRNDGNWHTNFKIEKQDNETLKVSGEKYFIFTGHNRKSNKENINYMIYKKSETSYQGSPGQFQEISTFSINPSSEALELNGVACTKISNN